MNLNRFTCFYECKYERLREIFVCLFVREIFISHLSPENHVVFLEQKLKSVKCIPKGSSSTTHCRHLINPLHHSAPMRNPL